LLFSWQAEEIFKSSQIEQKRRLLNIIFANLQIKDKKLIFDYTKPFCDFAKGFSYQLWGTILQSLYNYFAYSPLELDIEPIKRLKVVSFS
jgi:hypothetical protein